MPLLFLLMNTCFTGGGKFFIHATQGRQREEGWLYVLRPQGADSLPHSPLPLRVAKTGKNHLNKEINPLLPTGIGERFSQTILNIGHADVSSPQKRKGWTNSGGSLYLILYSEVETCERPTERANWRTWAHLRLAVQNLFSNAWILKQRMALSYFVLS